VCRSADNQDDLCIRPLAGELFIAGSQKLGRDLPVPALEVPLHIRRGKCLFDLTLQILRFLVEALAERWDGLCRKGGGGRHVCDKDHLEASRRTLQPIRCSSEGTLRRLGAVVSAYDLRPASKEQVQSLGGRFIELPIEAKDAQDARGYGTAQDETFYAKQRELLTRVVAESDVVITTAVVPGKKAPVLVTAEMVKGMAPGSVIFDLAGERGGNCELTQSGKTIVEHGVTIIGRINIATEVPYHASQMYARNLTAFLLHLVKDGKLQINLEDEITRETLLTRDGEIVNRRIREFFSLPALVSA